MPKASLQLIVNTINDPNLPLMNLREARIVLQDEYILSKNNEQKRKIILYLIRLLSYVLGISSGISLSGYFEHSFSELDKYFAALALISFAGIILLLIRDNRLSKEETGSSQKLMLYGNIIDARIFEKEFSELDVSQKTLRHLSELQSEIRQYNEIHKSQLAKWFWLGVAAMIFGAVVIIVTIVLGVSNDHVVSIISGLVSGVLIDYIGVIFIKMYAGTIESISKFETSVFEESRIYLANVLVSQIDDESLKKQTISDIAKSIVLKSGS